MGLVKPRGDCHSENSSVCTPANCTLATTMDSSASVAYENTWTPAEVGIGNNSDYRPPTVRYFAL